MQVPPAHDVAHDTARQQAAPADHAWAQAPTVAPPSMEKGRHAAQAAAERRLPPPVRASEAHDEAQAIIGDALAQAALVVSRAENAADSLLADAREDADRQVSDGKTTARVLREQAEAIVTAARHRGQELDANTAAEMAKVSAELDRARADHDEKLAALRTEATSRAAEELAQAQAQAALILDDAREDAEGFREQSSHEIGQARDEAEALRAQSRAEVAKMLDETRRSLTAEIAETAEQTAWTKQTMADLLAAAEVDAEKVRKGAQDDAEATIERARLRVQEIEETARAQQQERAETDERERASLASQARAVLEGAHSEAVRIRQLAGEEAEQMMTEVEDHVRAIAQRGDRRLAEAEIGAKAVREQAADDLSRIQNETRELRRSAKDEAARTVSEARAEADELRSTARTMLAEARAEVAVLGAHRDEISKQLGDLSGVINALAVAERPDEHVPETRQPQPPRSD